MKKVLFTGGGGAGYEAFYRLLKKKWNITSNYQLAVIFIVFGIKS